MATPIPDDLALNGWFVVKLDGSPISEETYFRECKGLDMDITPETFEEGGKNDGSYKLPSPQYSNVVLKRGVSCSAKFMQWIQASARLAPGTFKRVSGTISLRTRDQKPILEWKFNNAWPCRYAGPTMNAETHELAVEEIEIAHEGIELQAGGAA